MPNRRLQPAPTRPIVVPALVLLLALAAGACSPTADPNRRAPSGNDANNANNAEWRWLLQAQQQLDDKRAELAGLEAASGPGTPAAATPRERLAREVDTLAVVFGRRLVAFINSDPPLEGAPLSQRQLAAIRMRSDEEIVVAHQFIARAGDYRRACDIYEAALAADPRNPRLREELARAQAARYLSAERFARVAAGMTDDQVRAALGPPNPHDVREYLGKGVVGWFYPRDAAGTAAAVWFTRHDGGRLTAYRCDWSALPEPPLPGPQSSPGQAAQVQPPS
jgi:hypothetical protein